MCVLCACVNVHLYVFMCRFLSLCACVWMCVCKWLCACVCVCPSVWCVCACVLKNPGGQDYVPCLCVCVVTLNPVASRVLQDAKERELPLEDTEDWVHRRRAPSVFRLLRARSNSNFYPVHMLKEIANYNYGGGSGWQINNQNCSNSERHPF